MAIQSVIVKNFRNYESYAVEFKPGVTIIVGPNASGKTNLLESVYMLAQGSSFRVSDKDIVARGSEWSRLDGMFDGSERTLKLKLGQPKTQKTFTINDLKTKFKHYTYQLTMECAGNGRYGFTPQTSGNQWQDGAVSCAEWRGVRLRDVLESAGIKDNEKYKLMAS